MGHAVGNDGAVLARLQELRAPVVAINPAYRPNDIDGLRAHGVEAVLVSGVAHFLMMEDAAAFNRVLDEVVGGFGR